MLLKMKIHIKAQDHPRHRRNADRLVAIRRLAPSRGSPEKVMTNSFASVDLRAAWLHRLRWRSLLLLLPAERKLREPLSDRHRGPTRAVSKCTSPKDRSRRPSILLCLPS